MVDIGFPVREPGNIDIVSVARDRNGAPDRRNCSRILRSRRSIWVEDLSGDPSKHSGQEVFTILVNSDGGGGVRRKSCRIEYPRGTSAGFVVYFPEERARLVRNRSPGSNKIPGFRVDASSIAKPASESVGYTGCA